MPYQTRDKMQKLTELLLNSDDNGLSTGEMAEALHVSQQTIRNFLDRLSAEGVPIQDVPGKRRYAIDKTNFLRPMRLSLAQAWMLYIPLRRMVRASLPAGTTARLGQHIRQ